MSAGSHGAGISHTDVSRTPEIAAAASQQGPLSFSSRVGARVADHPEHRYATRPTSHGGTPALRSRRRTNLLERTIRVRLQEIPLVAEGEGLAPCQLDAAPNSRRGLRNVVTAAGLCQGDVGHLVAARDDAGRFSPEFPLKVVACSLDCFRHLSRSDSLAVSTGILPPHAVCATFHLKQTLFASAIDRDR